MIVSIRPLVDRDIADAPFPERPIADAGERVIGQREQPTLTIDLREHQDWTD